MIPVVWLEPALEDLAAITHYIADRNPRAASNLLLRLQEDAEALGGLPATYRRGPLPGTRQFVCHPNYILIYRITTVAVEILNVVHSRQQYPWYNTAPPLENSKFELLYLQGPRRQCNARAVLKRNTRVRKMHAGFAFFEVHSGPAPRLRFKARSHRPIVTAALG